MIPAWRRRLELQSRGQARQRRLCCLSPRTSARQLTARARSSCAYSERFKQPCSKAHLKEQPVLECHAKQQHLRGRKATEPKAKERDGKGLLRKDHRRASSGGALSRTGSLNLDVSLRVRAGEQEREGKRRRRRVRETRREAGRCWKVRQKPESTRRRLSERAEVRRLSLP